ncbi:MAG TPA: hypothetical protein VHE53_05010 [Patescibacteria group bacterium]|nr:hypothetical protein [Patescibacteria group bacterium]
MTEALITYDRQVAGEEAIAIRAGVNNLDNPRLIQLLERTGVSQNLFRKLINADCEWEVAPHTEEYFVEGKKLEDLTRMVAKTELGPVEISDVKLYGGAINPDDMGFHLKQSPNPGFEAILVQNGNAQMRIPDSVEPIGELYAKSEGYTDVALNKGDLLFLPAPVANNWSYASEDFEFRYICFPRWNKNLIAPAV